MEDLIKELEEQTKLLNRLKNESYKKASNIIESDDTIKQNDELRSFLKKSLQDAKKGNLNVDTFTNLVMEKINNNK